MIFFLLVAIIPAIAAQNLTCRVKPRAECFMGTCPNGFTCLENKCCGNNDIVKPAAECTDYVQDCSTINCDHIAFYEFARANCAKTCNFCTDKPLAPEYHCSDILDDCKDRTQLCTDVDFRPMMALYCPRTCAICTFNAPATCQDSLPDCAERGEKFCSGMTSDYQRRVGCGSSCKLC